MMLIIVGAPGLFVALLMWWLIEPERKNKVRNDDQSVPLSQVWAFINERRMFFFLVFLGYSALRLKAGRCSVGWLNSTSAITDGRGQR